MLDIAFADPLSRNEAAVYVMVRTLRWRSAMLSLRPRTLRRDLRITLMTALGLAIASGAALAPRRGHADDGPEDKAEANERCAVRVAVTLTGKSPDAALMASADPQSAVDQLVTTPEFADRYARFVNSRFNGGPADTAANDPVYWLAKQVITDDEPWADLFTGPYDVVANAAGNGMDVKADPNGLGYFKTSSWMKRYAGNEPAGMMLSASFRILSNTTGLELTPSVGQPGDDRTATGRAAQPCRSCHFDPWYALDDVAKLLPTRKGQGDAMTFTAPAAGPQKLLDGRTVADEKALVEALVASDPWKFAQCRNVFLFLYGRPENQCEAPAFDACVGALEQQKTIRAAVAVVAKDPSFCK